MYKCLESKTAMDYELMFMQELSAYGKNCVKVKLPPIPGDIDSLIEAKDEFKPEYNLKTNNCAHLSARILRFFHYIHNPRIEQIQWLTPKDLFNFTVALGKDTKPVTDLEMAYALIKSDLRQLEDMAKDLLARGHENAAIATRILISNINQELMNFALLPNKTIEEWNKVQMAISTIIGQAEPTLAKHRGMKKILGNIMLGILMVGVIYAITILIKGLVTGHYLFFHDTRTSEIARRIEETADKVKTIPIEEKKKEEKVLKHVTFDENTYVQPIDFNESKQRPQREVKA